MHSWFFSLPPKVVVATLSAEAGSRTWFRGRRAIVVTVGGEGALAGRSRGPLADARPPFGPSRAGPCLLGWSGTPGYLPGRSMEAVSGGPGEAGEPAGAYPRRFPVSARMPDHLLDVDMPLSRSAGGTRELSISWVGRGTP